ncbi:MAG: hypothetical protein ACPHO2_03390, partial [Candidatus Puniceispirillaceae bacterium]
MSAETTHGQAAHEMNAPDIEVNVRDLFGLDIDMRVPAFSTGSAYVPAIDPDYQFDHDTTLAILAGFAGVLVITRPGVSVNVGHIFLLCAAIAWSISIL